MKIEIEIPKLWSLQTSGRYLEVVVNSGLTVCLFFHIIAYFCRTLFYITLDEGPSYTQKVLVLEYQIFLFTSLDHKQKINFLLSLQLFIFVNLLKPLTLTHKSKMFIANIFKPAQIFFQVERKVEKSLKWQINLTSDLVHMTKVQKLFRTLSIRTLFTKYHYLLCHFKLCMVQ